jgi:hypothetical protein
LFCANDCKVGIFLLQFIYGLSDNGQLSFNGALRFSVALICPSKVSISCKKLFIREIAN